MGMCLGALGGQNSFGTSHFPPGGVLWRSHGNVVGSAGWSDFLGYLPLPPGGVLGRSHGNVGGSAGGRGEGGQGSKMPPRFFQMRGSEPGDLVGEISVKG